MSQYFDDKELFMSPKTTQYGSHMVMTNVGKETKTQYVNIDTRFRDEYNHSNYQNVSNYNLTLPYRFTEVKSISVSAMELPITYYNISATLKNNSIKITDTSNAKYGTIVIPDGQYNISDLITAVNTGFGTVATSSGNTNFTHLSIVSYSSTTNSGNKFSRITNSTTPSILVEFDIDSLGNFDKYNIKSKLGWILGYRSPSYLILGGSTIQSETFIDINGPKYVYLVVDEYSSGNQKSFLSTLPTSQINKNILARISISQQIYPYGTIEIANFANGLLTTDIRSYTGKVDIQRLTVQLVDENGTNVNLNGSDFSFCLKIQHE